MLVTISRNLISSNDMKRLELFSDRLIAITTLLLTNIKLTKMSQWESCNLQWVCTWDVNMFPKSRLRPIKI